MESYSFSAYYMFIVQHTDYRWLAKPPKISWPFFLSKLDSLVIKTLNRPFFTLSECLSNVLITGKSHFDENNGQRNVQLIRGSFLKK